MSEYSLRTIAIKTMIVHTVSYFVMGVLAFFLVDYAALFNEPVLRDYMRPINHPLVISGVLFQPIRGVLFGLVFYAMRDILFTRRSGWQVAWLALVVFGIVSTFGAAPGSIEGFVYTQVPVWAQIKGLPEILVQSFLLAYFSHYWISHPEKKWFTRAMTILFVLILVGASAGALTRLGVLGTA